MTHKKALRTSWGLPFRACQRLGAGTAIRQPSDVLLAICKLYGTSADYLLGLTDIDPSDEARKQRQRLTEEEQNEMHRYEEYLLWKRKK